LKIFDASVGFIHFINCPILSQEKLAAKTLIEKAEKVIEF